MTALARTRRRNTLVMLIASLIGVVVLGVCTFVGVDALRHYEGAKNVDENFVALASTPVGMMAIVDDNDRLSTVTVFVLDQPDENGEQVGGSIVSVPVSSDIAFGIDARHIPLTQVYAEQGAEGLTRAVESLLTLTINQSQVVKPDEAATLLTPIAPIAVTLPSDVFDGTPTGRELVYSAGDVSLSSEQLVSVLTASVAGEKDVDRRPTIEAVWTGVAAAIGGGRTEVADGTPIGSLSDLLNRLYAGPTGFRGLAVSPFPEGETPRGVDVEELDRADATMVFASIAPSNMSAPANGLIFRIEAPPGYDAKVKEAVNIVLYFGQNVQSVFIDASVPVKEVTEIELYDESFAADTSDVNGLLGSIEIVEPTRKIAGVDVVLRLGTQFLTGTAGGQLPSTTSTTTG